MPEAISNTSPLLYLYRIEALNWLPELFLVSRFGEHSKCSSKPNLKA